MIEHISLSDKGKEVARKINSNFDELWNGGGYNGELYDDKKPLRDIVANKSDKTFLFFSDIHNQATNMAHIVDVANRWADDGKLDFILNGGDTVSLQADSFDWYLDAVDDCDVDVVFALGNHELKGSGATKAICYTKFIAPSVQRLSNVVQPTGASTNNLCYFYKDYGNLRVISYDTPNTNSLTPNASDTAAYLAAQDSWLADVLADAKSNSKQVLILTHYPFLYEDVVLPEGAENWNSFYRYENGEVDTAAAWDIFDSTCQIVDTFINGGGKFIGWFTGHVHYNNFITNERHPAQVMWNIGTARNDYGQADMPYTTNPDNPNYDQFCYVGVDLTHHLLKIMKIGRTRCNQLRLQNCICWDYGKHELVANG